jgi:hypothetical protein
VAITCWRTWSPFTSAFDDLQIGAPARLGVAVDIAAAIRQGTKPDALRREVLEAAAARDKATATVATAPITGETGPAAGGTSPIVTRAKATAAKHQKT